MSGKFSFRSKSSRRVPTSSSPSSSARRMRDPEAIREENEEALPSPPPRRATSMPPDMESPHPSVGAAKSDVLNTIKNIAKRLGSEYQQLPDDVLQRELREELRKKRKSRWTTKSKSMEFVDNMKITVIEHELARRKSGLGPNEKPPQPPSPVHQSAITTNDDGTRFVIDPTKGKVQCYINNVPFESGTFGWRRQSRKQSWQKCIFAWTVPDPQKSKDARRAASIGINNEPSKDLYIQGVLQQGKQTKKEDKVLYPFSLELPGKTYQLKLAARSNEERHHWMCWLQRCVDGNASNDPQRFGTLYKYSSNRKLVAGWEEKMVVLTPPANGDELSNLQYYSIKSNSRQMLQITNPRTSIESLPVEEIRGSHHTIVNFSEMRKMNPVVLALPFNSNEIQSMFWPGRSLGPQLQRGDTHSPKRNTSSNRTSDEDYESDEFVDPTSEPENIQHDVNSKPTSQARKFRPEEVDESEFSTPRPPREDKRTQHFHNKNVSDAETPLDTNVPVYRPQSRFKHREHLPPESLLLGRITVFQNELDSHVDDSLVAAQLVSEAQLVHRSVQNLYQDGTNFTSLDTCAAASELLHTVMATVDAISTALTAGQFDNSCAKLVEHVLPSAQHCALFLNREYKADVDCVEIRTAQVAASLSGLVLKLSLCGLSTVQQDVTQVLKDAREQELIQERNGDRDAEIIAKSTMVDDTKSTMVDDTKSTMVDDTKSPMFDDTKSPMFDDTKSPMVDDTKSTMCADEREAIEDALPEVGTIVSNIEPQSEVVMSPSHTASDHSTSEVASTPKSARSLAEIGSPAPTIMEDDFDSPYMVDEFNSPSPVKYSNESHGDSTPVSRNEIKQPTFDAAGDGIEDTGDTNSEMHDEVTQIATGIESGLNDCGGNTDSTGASIGVANHDTSSQRNPVSDFRSARPQDGPKSVSREDDPNSASPGPEDATDLCDNVNNDNDIPKSGDVSNEHTLTFIPLPDQNQFETEENTLSAVELEKQRRRAARQQLQTMEQSLDTAKSNSISDEHLSTKPDGAENVEKEHLKDSSSVQVETSEAIQSPKSSSITESDSQSTAHVESPGPLPKSPNTPSQTELKARTPDKSPNSTKISTSRRTQEDNSPKSPITTTDPSNSKQSVAAPTHNTNGHQQVAASAIGSDSERTCKTIAFDEEHQQNGPRSGWALLKAELSDDWEHRFIKFATDLLEVWSRNSSGEWKEELEMELKSVQLLPHREELGGVCEIRILALSIPCVYEIMPYSSTDYDQWLLHLKEQCGGHVVETKQTDSELGALKVNTVSSVEGSESYYSPTHMGEFKKRPQVSTAEWPRTSENRFGTVSSQTRKHEFESTQKSPIKSWAGSAQFERRRPHTSPTLTSQLPRKVPEFPLVDNFKSYESTRYDNHSKRKPRSKTHADYSDGYSAQMRHQRDRYQHHNEPHHGDRSFVRRSELDMASGSGKRDHHYSQRANVDNPMNGISRSSRYYRNSVNTYETRQWEPSHSSTPNRFSRDHKAVDKLVRGIDVETVGRDGHGLVRAQLRLSPSQDRLLIRSTSGGKPRTAHNEWDAVVELSDVVRVSQGRPSAAMLSAVADASEYLDVRACERLLRECTASIRLSEGVAGREPAPLDILTRTNADCRDLCKAIATLSHLPHSLGQSYHQ